MIASPILFEVFVPMAAIRVVVTRTSELKQVDGFNRYTDEPAMDAIKSMRRDASDWFGQDFQSAMTMPHSKPL